MTALPEPHAQPLSLRGVPTALPAQGTDPAGVVTVETDPEGTPVKFTLSEDWQDHIEPRALKNAVIDALASARTRSARDLLSQLVADGRLDPEGASAAAGPEGTGGFLASGREFLDALPDLARLSSAITARTRTMEELVRKVKVQTFSNTGTLRRVTVSVSGTLALTDIVFARGFVEQYAVSVINRELTRAAT